MAVLLKLIGLVAELKREKTQRKMTGAMRKLSVALKRGYSWSVKAGLTVGVDECGAPYLRLVCAAGLAVVAEEEGYMGMTHAPFALCD